MLVIDRFEGKWAVIEFDRSTFNIPKKLLPEDVKEGDIINIQITVDQKTTERQKSFIAEKAAKLFEE